MSADYLTTEAVAKDLGISVEAVLKRASRRHLQPHDKEGHSYTWSPNAVRAMRELIPVERPS